MDKEESREQEGRDPVDMRPTFQQRVGQHPLDSLVQVNDTSMQKERK